MISDLLFIKMKKKKWRKEEEREKQIDREKHRRCEVGLFPPPSLPPSRKSRYT